MLALLEVMGKTPAPKYPAMACWTVLDKDETERASVAVTLVRLLEQPTFPPLLQRSLLKIGAPGFVTEICNKSLSTAADVDDRTLVKFTVRLPIVNPFQLPVRLWSVRYPPNPPVPFPPERMVIGRLLFDAVNVEASPLSVNNGAHREIRGVRLSSAKVMVLGAHGNGMLCITRVWSFGSMTYRGYCAKAGAG